MHKLAITALAVALGLAWSTMPALGADPNDKTVKEKAVETKDKVKEKTSEAWDKTKEKTAEAKDKVMAKLDTKDTRNAQQALRDKGHDPGPIDGIYGPRTTAAMRSYQKAENLQVTGQMDAETRAHLLGGQASPAASPATGAPQPAPSSSGSPSAPAEAPGKVQKP